MGVLLILGGILAVIGVIVALVNVKNLKRRHRIMSTPTSPIAQAPGGGLVEIKGRILPSEQGVVQAPFSGRHGVWVRVTVQEQRRSGRSTYWHTVFNDADGRVFIVDDGSGQQARVHPQGSNVMLDAQHVASSGTFREPPPHLQAFLASRGMSSTNWLGFNKNMRYAEEVLAPGDNLYALGPARRDAGPPVQDGYRNAPSNQLVLFHAPGPDGELLLTNKTEEQLVSKLLWGFVGGAIMGGIGAALCVAGMIAALVR